MPSFDFPGKKGIRCEFLRERSQGVGPQEETRCLPSPPSLHKDLVKPRLSLLSCPGVTLSPEPSPLSRPTDSSLWLSPRLPTGHLQPPTLCKELRARQDGAEVALAKEQQWPQCHLDTQPGWFLVCKKADPVPALFLRHKLEMRISTS